MTGNKQKLQKPFLILQHPKNTVPLSSNVLSSDDLVMGAIPDAPTSNGNGDDKEGSNTACLEGNDTANENLDTSNLDSHKPDCDTNLPSSIRSNSHSTQQTLPPDHDHTPSGEQVKVLNVVGVVRTRVSFTQRPVPIVITLNSSHS